MGEDETFDSIIWHKFTHNLAKGLMAGTPKLTVVQISPHATSPCWTNRSRWLMGFVPI
jgi:hypothetical protein